jgi:GNAT superfamily N-acetyltransferase
VLEIKKIAPEDTYSLRQSALRPNQPIEASKYENDYLEDTFHLGAFLDGILISIASFYKEKNPCFTDEVQFRLRGMATLPEYRKQKAGSSLILHAEELLREKKVTLWWCNARATVSNYYKKLGLSECGEVFEIEPIGPHKLMFKKLS